MKPVRNLGQRDCCRTPLFSPLYVVPTPPRGGPTGQRNVIAACPSASADASSAVVRRLQARVFSVVFFHETSRYVRSYVRPGGWVKARSTNGRMGSNARPEFARTAPGMRWLGQIRPSSVNPAAAAAASERVKLLWKLPPSSHPARSRAYGHRPVCLTEPLVLYARPVRVRVYNHRGRRGRLSCRGTGGPWGARGKKKRAPCRRTQRETRIRRGVDRLWIPNCACPRDESAGSRRPEFGEPGGSYGPLVLLTP